MGMDAAPKRGDGEGGVTIGQGLLEVARDEARRIVGDAIDYRRDHPYVFYRFHAHMADLRRHQGRLLAAWWHRQWRARYWAKAMASAEAQRCREVV